MLAPGKWAPDLLRLDLPLVVERRVQHWFAPPSVDDFRPGRLPVWIWDRADGTSMYGAPAQGGRDDVKAAVHFSTVRPADAWTVDEIAAVLAELFPRLGRRHIREAECWYTLTPDENFVVGPHPESDHVVVLRVRLLGSWLQVHPGARGGAGRPGDRRRDEVRPEHLRPAARRAVRPA